MYFMCIFLSPVRVPATACLQQYSVLLPESPVDWIVYRNNSSTLALAIQILDQLWVVWYHTKDSDTWSSILDLFTSYLLLCVFIYNQYKLILRTSYGVYDKYVFVGVREFGFLRYYPGGISVCPTRGSRQSTARVTAFVVTHVHGLCCGMLVFWYFCIFPWLQPQRSRDTCII